MGMDNSEIDRLAEKVTRLGLEMPVAILLEMHKPITNLVLHGLMFIDPIFSGFISLRTRQSIQALFEDSHNLDRLIHSLNKSNT